MRFRRIWFCFIVLSVWSTEQNLAQVYPSDFGQVLVANGIANPTAMAFAPDGRIFVAEQGGKLRVIKNNSLLTTPFVQLTVSASGERGLIGIALDPNFVTNNFIYLYYTVPGAPAHNRISRFTANGDVVLTGSETVVLELDPLSTATNHNGGAMHFGKDGKLYVAVGENANAALAQNLDTYHGKLLRINSDGSVPEGNPFTSGSEQRQRIWAYGLRNPYTFSIHPETGQILVNDVGQVTWEEINDATTGGKNFGWPTTEGKFNATAYPTLTNPIYAYPHGTGDGKGCAITGGTFFYPTVTNYPSGYIGKYFFQDLCNRWINTLDLTGNTIVRSSFATSIQGNSLAMSVGPDGNVYYLSRTSNALYKIIYNKATVPFILSHPVALTIPEGQVARFSVKALGTTPIEYQWRKNGLDIIGATDDTLTIENASFEDQGEYTVVVSNEAGSAISNVALLTVDQNTAPVPEIQTPTLGTTYVAGSTIEFSGTANDAEDGPLPATAFQWQVNFHHANHRHDEPSLSGITSGAFFIPDEGETSDDVWYRIILTVTDSRGLQGQDSIDIMPRKSAITIETDPPGLTVLVDGQPVGTPVEIVGVEGIIRTFGVDSPQKIDEVLYEFASWSNGGASMQTFPMPEDDLHLTAHFSVVVGTETAVELNDVFLYPNPTITGQVLLKLVSGQQQHVVIRLVNMLSQQVYRAERSIAAGLFELPLVVGKQAGIYSVIIQTADSVIVRKLIVGD